MMNYKNGDIDLCFFSTSLLTQYEADSDVKDQIQMYMPGSTQFVNLNLNESKLQDARVREAKEDTIAADRQLVRTDFATIPVVWPKTPYVLREGYDGLSILVNFHYKDMSKSA